MTAYNVVRMRVKPGRNEDYLEAHRAIDRDTFAGMKSVAIIQTGERDFCLIGEWDSMDAIVAARPKMIETLDRSREMLEDLGGDLGVTDPVSGEVVLEVHREMACDLLPACCGRRCCGIAPGKRQKRGEIAQRATSILSWRNLTGG